MSLTRSIKLILTLRCREASGFTSRASDGDLPWDERLALRLHLAICRPCRQFRRQIGISRELMAETDRDLQDSASTDPSESEGLSAAARQRLQQAVDSAE